MGSTMSAQRAVSVRKESTTTVSPRLSMARATAFESGSMATGEEGLWPHDDILSWDVDAVVADLSREEREELKQRLESRR